MPSGTMKARWYLVQVDMESTPKINQIFRYSGKYYCMFLANNPNKKQKAENSVYGGRIGTIKSLESKQEKSYMETGSKSTQILIYTVQNFHDGQPSLCFLRVAMTRLLDHSTLNTLIFLIASVKKLDLHQCQNLCLAC